MDSQALISFNRLDMTVNLKCGKLIKLPKMPPGKKIMIASSNKPVMMGSISLVIRRYSGINVMMPAPSVGPKI
jgi:hypothetical protein